MKQNALVESAEREGLKQRIRERREFLERQSKEVTEYDELLVRRLIEKVTVYDERFEVEFKSGAKVDVGGEVNNRTVVWYELLGLLLVFRCKMIVINSSFCYNKTSILS